MTGTYGGANQGDISVLFGRGRGRLSPPHLFPATGSGTTNLAIAVGRFNADTAPDLVVPDFNDPRVAILYGRR